MTTSIAGWYCDFHQGDSDSVYWVKSFLAVFGISSLTWSATRVQVACVAVCHAAECKLCTCYTWFVADFMERFKRLHISVPVGRIPPIFPATRLLKSTADHTGAWLTCSQLRGRTPVKRVLTELVRSVSCLFFPCTVMYAGSISVISHQYFSEINSI